MKRIFLLTIALLIGFMSLHAMNKGSAKQLKGKIYVLSVFVSDKEWSKKQKKVVLDKVLEAEKWLKKSARKYGSNIEFKNGRLGWDKTLIMNPKPKDYDSGELSTYLVHDVVRKLGFAQPQDVITWAKEKVGADQVVVMIFVDGPGRGYAMPYSEGSTKRMLEGAVLFCDSSLEQPVRPASIAHEILHLFGAWDLYETDATSKKMEDRAKDDFPGEIMGRSPYNISDAVMSDLTAWRVGIAPYQTKFLRYNVYRKNMQ